MSSLPAIASAPSDKVPVVYDKAVKAIAACCSLDDAQAWANKADALSAWAKMYHDDRIGAEAKRLKLLAYRRMAALADELTPGWRPKAGRTKTGPSPKRALVNAGLRETAAETVVQVGKVSQRKFEKAVMAENPPTPGALAWIESAECPEWARVGRALGVFRAVAGHHTPRSLAKRLPFKQLPQAKRLCIDAIEWLRAFEHELTERL